MTAGRDGGARPDDVDTIFAEIVSGWQADGTAPRWPESLDDETGPDAATAPAAPTPPRAGPTPPPAGPAGPPPVVPNAPEPPAPPTPPTPAAGPSGATGSDEHFVPPEPPPLPRLRRRTVGGLIVLVLGVVLVAVPDVFGLSGQVGLLLGLVAMTSGVGWLVLGLRDGPPRDSGWDDGAAL